MLVEGFKSLRWFKPLRWYNSLRWFYSLRWYKGLTVVTTFSNFHISKFSNLQIAELSNRQIGTSANWNLDRKKATHVRYFPLVNLMSKMIFAG